MLSAVSYSVRNPYSSVNRTEWTTPPKCKFLPKGAEEIPQKVEVGVNICQGISNQFTHEAVADVLQQTHLIFLKSGITA